MRYYLLTVLMLLTAVFPAEAEISFSTGLRTDMFTDDVAPESIGYELTAPLGLVWRRKQFQLVVESAYASANIHSENESVKLDSLTDTRISASYGFLKFPISLIVGLDLNLPTGSATLTESERKVEIGDNGDLFEVDDFGEGFNMTPSLGLIKKFGAVTLGGNVAYIFRGEYDPSAETPDDDLDPGDQALLLGMFQWQASRRVTLDGFLVYSHFGKDQINGRNYFQEGDTVTAGLNGLLSYKRWSFAARFQQVFQRKNKELNLDDELKEETANSNGRQFFSLLELNYRYTDTLTFQILGDVRYYGESQRRDENEDLPFTGGRRRYALGLGFTHVANEHVALNGLVKLFTLEKEKDLYWDQDTTFQGGNLSLGITYMF